MPLTQTRRDFAASVSAAGAAALLGCGDALADEGPPETTTIRLSYNPNICLSPAYMAGDLLRAEGFTEIHYIPLQTFDNNQLARGEIDYDLTSAASLVSDLDAGKPITVLAGVHPGCYELFAHEPIRTIGDLKGKRVGIQEFGSASHSYLSVMAAHVGLDPQTDIEWVTSPTGNFMALFAEGKVDAFLAFPPEPQELRARKIGRVILNLGTDKPWSQYFCCMAFGNRSFVREHPVTTKRVLRAILKATDLCATEPETVAQRLVDIRYTPRYDYALQTLTELPYTRWREFDPEDSMRFYALQLHEVGMIRSSPKQILAEGTDWRFLHEIKRELKV